MNTITEPITYDYPKVALQGKRAVVSGGTTGIGRAIAVALAARGAQVFIFGRTEKHLDDALKDLQEIANGRGVHGIIADQARKEDVERVFERATEAMEGVDILVNNAGIPGESLEDSNEDWKYVIETNLLGCMYCCEAAIPLMKEAGGGQIVNIGSLSAKSRGEGLGYLRRDKNRHAGILRVAEQGRRPRQHPRHDGRARQGKHRFLRLEPRRARKANQRGQGDEGRGHCRVRSLCPIYAGALPPHDAAGAALAHRRLTVIWAH